MGTGSLISAVVCAIVYNLVDREIVDSQQERFCVKFMPSSLHLLQ